MFISYCFLCRFVRLVSSGQLHFLADGCRFIPDLDDIPEFSVMVREAHDNVGASAELKEQIQMASSNVDSALKCLSSAVTDGVDYLRLLANGFAGPLREQRFELITLLFPTAFRF